MNYHQHLKAVWEPRELTEEAKQDSAQDRPAGVATTKETEV